jgi:hypothetical protein
MPGTRGMLGRRYHLLMLCYPRGYRRTRGEEIVATFLDLAPADRTRPTLREAADLVRHGLRCRLGRPASRTVVVWAALTAVAWGLFTGGFAARLAWETARPLPTQGEATQLFSDLLGQDVTGQVGVDPALFVIYGQPLGRDNLHLLFSPDAGEYQQGSASVNLNGQSDVDHNDLVDSARAWLRAHGWRVSNVIVRNRAECTGCDESTLPKSAVFGARRGDDVIRMEISVGARQPPAPKPAVVYSGDTYAHVDLTRANPAGVVPFSAAGVLLGVAVGWLVFGWASRRLEGRSRLLRAITTILFAVAVTMWYLPMIAMAFNASSLLSEPYGFARPVWEWLGQPALAPLFILGTGAASLILVTCATPRRRGSATDVRPAV